jgi:membrane associated rhomboid family serine protease
MAYSTRSYARPYALSGGLPPGIKWLLIVNVAVFLLQFFGGGALGAIFRWMPLYPDQVVTHLFVWQLVTYMFLHGGIGHILFNMLALWMFGSEIERTWGTDRFLKFYFACGIGAGICVVVINYLFGNPSIATIGASGAVYGLLLASAVLWPDRIILAFFFFPMKMKWFVAIIGGIAFLNSFGANTGVSEVAHLGGMAVGYAMLRRQRQRQSHGRAAASFNAMAWAAQAYKSWKLARAKRKFQVYLKKQGSDRGPWVN